jgi:hypothetical protein
MLTIPIRAERIHTIVTFKCSPASDQQKKNNSHPSRAAPLTSSDHFAPPFHLPIPREVKVAYQIDKPANE